jgi:AcrR family transcriptional regulator
VRFVASWFAFGWPECLTALVPIANLLADKQGPWRPESMASNLKLVNDKERNPARSREVILDAAEELFAQQGYDGTSLNQVGVKAGVSRGTPGYFFGSKEALYQAVLERCFRRVRDAIRSGRDRALASQEPSEVVLAGAVAEYFDFIMANPNFVRLMEREALSGAEHLSQLPNANIVNEAVSAISDELGLDTTQGIEAAHLVLSIIGLCWFPAVHASTVMPALGFNADDKTFRDQRKEHVVNLVLRGVQGRIPSPNFPL